MNNIISRSAYLFLGLPGSGKSTQISVFAEQTPTVVFAAGELLQRRARAGFSEALQLIQSGSPIPPSEFSAMLSAEIATWPDDIKTICFDGSPRTRAQVKIIKAHLDPAMAGSSAIVIVIKVPVEAAFARLVARTDLGSERLDNAEDVIGLRLAAQADRLDDVVDACRTHWPVVSIDGTKDTLTVARDIRNALVK